MHSLTCWFTCLRLIAAFICYRNYLGAASALACRCLASPSQAMWTWMAMDTRVCSDQTRWRLKRCQKREMKSSKWKGRVSVFQTHSLAIANTRDRGILFTAFLS